MANPLDTVIATLQNGVTAMNNLISIINTTFPHTTASSSFATAGTITFTSSQAAGFMVVTTSSGGTVKVPFYS
jgi:hypothetical protein